MHLLDSARSSRGILEISGHTGARTNAMPLEGHVRRLAQLLSFPLDLRVQRGPVRNRPNRRRGKPLRTSKRFCSIGKG